MHHQLDFVIQIIDAMTDAAVIGGVNQFWLGGQPIRPTKVTETFFVFANILSNPMKVHVNAPLETVELTWHNPYYQEVKLTIPLVEMSMPSVGNTYYLRALPSAFYPFKYPVTGVKGIIHDAEFVRLKHEWNMNRYHLTKPAEPGSLLMLTQSLNRQMSGKSLLLSENGQESIVKLEPNDLQQFYLPLTMPHFSEEADVFEVIEVPMDAYGLFFLVLPNLQRDFEQAEVRLTIANADQVGFCKAHLLKDQIIDIGHLEWDELEKE